MPKERISLASTFDPENRSIVTDEISLLKGNSIEPSILAGDSFDYRVLLPIGKRNHLQFLARTKQFVDIDVEDLTIDDRLGHATELLRWSKFLIGRELAVRSFEMAILADVDPNSVGDALKELSDVTGYDTARGILTKERPDLKYMAKTAKRELESGRSLGDLIAQERASNETSAMTFVSNATHHITDHDPTLIETRGYGQKQRKKRLHAIVNSKGEGLESSERYFMAREMELADMRLNLLPDDLQESYDLASALMRTIRFRRESGLQYNLYTTPESTYEYYPAHTHLYESTKDSAQTSPKERERIVIPPTEEELEAARKYRELQLIEQRQRDEERRAQAEAEKQEIEAYNGPILEELGRIKDEYTDLVKNFLLQPRSKLKQTGVVGNNSLTYTLSRAKGQDIDAAERIARVYSGLADIVKSSGESAGQELTDILERIEKLRAEYTAYLIENPLRNGALTRLEKIEDGFKDELSWLSTHWQEFKNAYGASSYKPTTNSELTQVARMLGILRDDIHELLPPVHQSGDDELVDDEPEEPTSPADIVADDKAPEPKPEPEIIPEPQPGYESPLAAANKLAEQLNWIVFPDEPISPDELVEIAEEATRKRSKDNKPAVVERYRMDALLRLREEFGGTLYRSQERMLDDVNNLYFVLRFQHPGDDNFYAVAENPVYGNATYILREDALPLMEGESVLAALQLYRRDARELGAKRIIHGTPQVQIHLEKVSDKIAELSEHERIAS